VKERYIFMDAGEYLELSKYVEVDQSQKKCIFKEAVQETSKRVNNISTIVIIDLWVMYLSFIFGLAYHITGYNSLYGIALITTIIAILILIGIYTRIYDLYHCFLENLVKRVENEDNG